MQIVRRSLFESDLLHAVHVRARGSSAVPGEVERQTTNVLVLPLAGLFAKHESPRRNVIATPNHALFIARDTPYRISLPGAIGDECLTLRFAPSALAKLAPHASRRDRFDSAAFATHTLLPPGLVLARGLLWRRIASGAFDVLELELRVLELLAAVLRVAEKQHEARACESLAQRRHVTRVIEAVSLAPERRWTLAALAELAGVSPWHLARGFRARMGVSLYRYVLRARLANALPAVLEPTTDLSRIAHDAGFASHSHFTARFAAVFGCTPRDLRRGSDARLARELSKIVTASARRTS